MKQHKPEQVWIGVEDLSNSPAFSKLAQDEFQQVSLTDPGSQEALMDTGSSRRDFLKYLGFGLGAATVAAACDTPVRRAIPYVVKPDTIVPGVASYYASSFVQGGDYCAVLVKTREGRPIKIEGNSLSKVTKGGTSARAQASVLSLYDNSRFQGPMVMADGRSTAAAWADMDKAIVGGLNESSRIRIVSHTLLSPTAKQVIEEFAAKYPATKHVIYDPVSSSAILEANAASFGQRLIPDYRFDKAMVIVSLGADFLGTWISPVEYAADYAVNRKIKDVKSPKMSRHIQVESYMSLTGSNADTRVLIKPSEQGAAIAALYNEVAALTGGSRVSAPALGEKAAEGIKKAAAELVAAKGASLVVSGSNNVGEQTLINAINSLLGNYGATISFHHASLQRQGIDGDVQGLIRHECRNCRCRYFHRRRQSCLGTSQRSCFQRSSC